MNVGQISETYTNLGRLQQGGPQPADAQEPRAPAEKTDTTPDSQSPEVQKAKPRLEETPRINLVEAVEMTADVSQTLINADHPIVGLSLHEISEASLIRPKYV